MTDEEVILLNGLYESAKAVLRYRGIDAERTEGAYQLLYDAVHDLNHFYLDPGVQDNETET